jgi:hypothetical protein
MMRPSTRRPLLGGALVLACLAGAPSPAAAHAPALHAGPAAPHPAPAPALRLALQRVYRMGGARIALLHQQVRVRGVVATYAPGQVVSVRVAIGRRRVATVRRTVRQVGAGGRFDVELKVRRPGTLRAFATGSGMSARSRTAQVIVPAAGWGARGTRVRFLQRRLRELRYLVPLSGRYEDGTARAVLAYRKVNGLPRTYSASRAIFQRLAHKRGAFRPKFPRHGKHVEADLSRQVLALIDRKGKVFRVLVTASGTSSTPTVRGSFRFYLKTPGTNALGMVHSNYFVGGYAIHGYPSVPTHPASHGCLRIPIPNARFVNRWIRLGDRIDVYR